MRQPISRPMRIWCDLTLEEGNYCLGEVKPGSRQRGCWYLSA